MFVVDKDIDIYNPQEVEWAMATRFQGDRDLVVKEREPGSSLDPSAEPGTHLTTQVGFDLTKPLETAGKTFARAPFPEVDLSRFMKDSRKMICTAGAACPVHSIHRWRCRCS